MNSLVLNRPGSLDTLTAATDTTGAGRWLVAAAGPSSFRELDGSLSASQHPAARGPRRPCARGGRRGHGTVPCSDGLALGLSQPESNAKPHACDSWGLSITAGRRDGTRRSHGRPPRKPASWRRARSVRLVIVTSRGDRRNDWPPTASLEIGSSSSSRAQIVRRWRAGSQDTPLQLYAWRRSFRARATRFCSGPRRGSHPRLAPHLCRQSRRESGDGANSCVNGGADGLEDRVWLAANMNAATLAGHYDSADVFRLAHAV